MQSCLSGLEPFEFIMQWPLYKYCVRDTYVEKLDRLYHNLRDASIKYLK